MSAGGALPAAGAVAGKQPLPPLPLWAFRRPVTVIRPWLQRLLVFPVLRYYLRLEVRGRARLEALREPALYYYNYQGPYAPLLLIRALPPARRARLALAVNATLWRGRDRWQGFFAALLIAAYPFAKEVHAARASLRATETLLRRGWSVAIAPEGEPEPGGELLPFLGGAGFLAVRLGAPVVPVRLEGFNLLFPFANYYPDHLRFPYLPDKRGLPVRLTFGRPLRFPPDMSHQRATQEMREAMLQLAADEMGGAPSP